jgi:hypothetical protein
VDSIAADEKKVFEESLERVKAQHCEEIEKLSSSLDTKKMMSSSNLRNRLAKKNTGKPGKDESSVDSLDNIVGLLKKRHNKLLQQLLFFIASQKASDLKALDIKKDFNHEKAKVLLFYNNVEDSLVNGFKKKCVYEVIQLKETSDVSEQYLDSTHLKDQAALNGASKLLERSTRDILGLTDSQFSERLATVKDLTLNSAPAIRINECETNQDSTFLDQVVTQFTRDALTLAGILLDRSYLDSIAIQITDDDDDYDDFGDSTPVVSTSNLSTSFSESLVNWFGTIKELIRLYCKSPSALGMYLSEVHNAVQLEKLPVAKLEISRVVKFSIQKVILPAIFRGFSSTLGGGRSITEQAASSSICAEFKSCEERNELKDAFTMARSKLTDKAIDDVEHVIGLYKKGIEKFLREPLISKSTALERSRPSREFVRMNSIQSLRNSSKKDLVKREHDLLDALKLKVDRRVRELSRYVYHNISVPFSHEINVVLNLFLDQNRPI